MDYLLSPLCQHVQLGVLEQSDVFACLYKKNPTQAISMDACVQIPHIFIRVLMNEKYYAAILQIRGI